MSKGKREIVGEDVCPDCGSSAIIRDEDSGEVVCGQCGLVINESLVDTGPEWRAFTQSEKESRSRVGFPLSYSVYDRGLTTVISGVGRDASGRKLPLEKKLQMLRLKRWQTRLRVHSSVDRNLAQAMSELSRLADRLRLAPPIKEEAAILYRKALEKDLVRGRSISAVVAASLYAACRITRTPRTIREFARQSPFDRHELSRCYRLLIKALNLKMPVPTPQLRVPKIAAKVGIGGKTQRTAVEILRKAKRLMATAGKDPMGLAAAALYIACLMNDEKHTQKTLSEAAGVTEVTIRNRYKSLKEALNLDV